MATSSPNDGTHGRLTGSLPEDSEPEGQRDDPAAAGSAPAEILTPAGALPAEPQAATPDAGPADESAPAETPPLGAVRDTLSRTEAEIPATTEAPGEAAVAEPPAEAQALEAAVDRDQGAQAAAMPPQVTQPGETVEDTELATPVVAQASAGEALATPAEEPAADQSTFLADVTSGGEAAELPGVETWHASGAAPAELPSAQSNETPAAPKLRRRGRKGKVVSEPSAAQATAGPTPGDDRPAASDEPAPEFRPVIGEAGQPVTLSLEALVESLLFVADGAVPVGRLAEALEVSPREVEAVLAALSESFRHRGLSLQRFRDRVQLTTAPAAAERVERFLGLAAAAPLSRAALETLAIIAYQQPVTRPQIEAVRGVNSDSVIKNLLSKGLVEESGRAEGPGRPVLYSTTTEFMQHFGLASLADLPPLHLPEGAEVPPAPAAEDISILKG